MTTISIGDVTIGESDGFAEFTVRLDQASTSLISVRWASNIGTAGYSDFTDLAGTLTFNPGETIKTFRIAINNDMLVEAREFFTVELTQPTNATIAKDVGYGTIIDNDAASGTPTVSISDFSIDEAAGEAIFVITLNRPNTSTVTMNYATVNGTAIAGSDFVGASGSLSFAPGQTARTVRIALINDALAEGAEAFGLRLSALVNAVSLDPVGTVVIGANDSTPVATPNISVSDVVIGETDGYTEFVVTLDAPGANIVTVQWASDIRTAGYSDFNDLSGTLTFAPGETLKTVRIPIINDSMIEVGEIFALELYSPTNAVIAKDIGTATIIDNDAASGTPVVSISDLIVDEASGEASFVITLDRPSSSTVRMNYGTVNGTAVAGSDYVATSGTISFAAGETAKTIKVGILNDSVNEGSESFTLRLTGLVNATTLDQVGTGLIGANDATPVAVPNITIDDVVVGEKDGFAEFVVRLDAPGANIVTVRWASDIRTAGYSDFTDLSGYLTFAPGEMLKTIRIPLTDDNTIEVGEIFALELYSPTNAVIAKDIGTATIIDNDAASGTPVVSISDLIIDEASGEASFVIALDRPSTSTVKLDYGTVNGTAVAGSDYVATSGTIRFAAGETAKTIKVGILNDSVTEGLESFTLRLTGLVNATTLDQVGTGVIGANDATPVAVPNITIDDVTVGEKDGFAEFVVRLDAPGANIVTVRWASDIRTAGYSDFTDLSGYLTFAPGEMLKTIRIPLTDDNTIEVGEIFALELYSPTNAVIARDIGTATIIDNDAASGTPVVSISDLIIDEASGEASFVIALDRPSTSTVKLDYGTVNGTAVAGSDYVATSGTIRFAAGETAKTIKVGILNDSLTEGLESFTLRLTGLVNATTLDQDGTGVIGANDSPSVAVPNISIDDVVVGEKDGFAEFVVRLDTPGANIVTVRWGSDIRTAGYSDFTDLSGYLTFAPGEMLKTIRIPITNDNIVEPIENIVVELYSPTQATIAKDIGTAFIVDNDAPSGTPGAHVGDPIVDEASGEVSFVITLDRPSTSVVSISYATQDISALAGSDYVAASGVIRFAPGETAKTIKVGILNDSLNEGSESFALHLTNIVNAMMPDPIGIATINRNDSAAVATPAISINDITIVENGSYAAFTVRFDAPGLNPVTVRWASNIGTAGYGDFSDLSGYLTFAPGETVKSILIPITNDTTVEAVESFVVELFSATGATIGKNIGLATIIDDDGTTPQTSTTINGTSVDDMLRGTGVNDTINGNDGNDVILAGFGADHLNGGSGNDVLDGGGGVDRMTGGVGNDIYLVQDVGDVVAEATNGGTDHVRSSLASYALTANVEYLTGMLDSGQTLIGNGLSNVMAGGAGNDLLNGASGADRMTGGLGNDIYVVDNAGDVVVEASGGGIDEVRVSLTSYTLGAGLENLTGLGAGNKVLTGNALNNVLTGGAGGDTLNGGAGNDVLNGGAGIDRMTGGTGNDIYVVDHSSDVVVEAANGGTDQVRTSLAAYTLAAQVENLTAIGNGNKVLNGNALNNVIVGGAGNDTINGGGGNDILTGGAGADTFRFTTTPGAGNMDEISDFTVIDDRIALAVGVFASAGPLGTLNANAFTIGSAAADANDRIIYDNNSGRLLYDADGNGAGAAVAFAQLDRSLALTNADFVII